MNEFQKFWTAKRARAIFKNILHKMIIFSSDTILLNRAARGARDSFRQLADGLKATQERV